MEPRPSPADPADAAADHLSDSTWGDAGTVLLRLLTRDTPAEVLESVGRDVGPSEESSCNRDTVRQQVELALQVRGLLDDHRRQARELRALFDTAGDLTALRDLDAVLRAICRRAKDLLGTKAAWINLPDPVQNDTFIHTTEGTVAAGGLRVPPGAGLAGLVAAVGTPQWTGDYSNDHRLVHYHLGDEWTRREGVKSALGVPLRRGGEVTGVIMAADHVTRQFTPAEVTLLQSLADHAAIAIENARLFTEAEQAMCDLSQANRKVRAHSTAIEMSVRFHDKLTELVLEGADLAGVLHAVVRGLGGRLLVIDNEWRVLAAAGACQDEIDVSIGMSDFLSDRDLTRLMEQSISKVGRATMIELGPGTAERIMVPLPPRSRPVGVLLFTNDHIPTSDQQLLERAALVAALLVLNAQAVSESEHHEYGEFLQTLFTESGPDDGALHEQAAALGIDLDEPHTLVIASRATRPTRSTRARASQLVARTGGLAGELDGLLAFLLPEMPAYDAAAVVAAELRSRESPETVTAAHPASGRAGLAAAYAEARQTARVLAALGRSGTTATADQLGAYGFILKNAGPGDASRYVKSVIGPLLDHDAATKGVLVETLNSYFAHNGHAADAAASMFVHVNTMYTRLNRIAGLLPDWNDPDGRLQIQLAVRIHHLAKHLGG